MPDEKSMYKERRLLGAGVDFERVVVVFRH